MAMIDPKPCPAAADANLGQRLGAQVGADHVAGSVGPGRVHARALPGVVLLLVELGGDRVGPDRGVVRAVGAAQGDTDQVGPRDDDPRRVDDLLQRLADGRCAQQAAGQVPEPLLGPVGARVPRAEHRDTGGRPVDRRQGVREVGEAGQRRRRVGQFPRLRHRAAGFQQHVAPDAPLVAVHGERHQGADPVGTERAQPPQVHDEQCRRRHRLDGVPEGRRRVRRATPAEVAGHPQHDRRLGDDTLGHGRPCRVRLLDGHPGGHRTASATTAHPCDRE